MMNDEVTEPAPGVTPQGTDHQIHEEFADPAARPAAPSHRKGMLGGLAAVGTLLAILVLVAPGGSSPKLPAQVIRDVSPSATVASNKAPAATASPTTAPNATGTTTTTLALPQGATVIEASNPGSTTTREAVTPATDRSASGPASSSTPSTPTTSTPATTPTTSPPPTPTPTTSPPPTPTPTTAPPPTTTTTSCVLGILCNG
jgi:hypothetical protein